jgi:hypothetical protein
MKGPIERPAEPQDSLYFKTDVSPEVVFQAIGRLRKEARDEIDRLIRFLDETDNHMEREPDDDEPEEAEPSLGSLDRMADQTRWGSGSCDDAEVEHDGREPQEEDELSDTGIADNDGLQEQVGRQDWQPGVFG